MIQPEEPSELVVMLFSGKRASGKTTRAEEMARRFRAEGCEVMCVSFADEARRRFALVRGLDSARLRDERAYKELYRPELARFAESAKVAYGPGFWAGLVTDAVARHPWTLARRRVVIDDLRFVAEMRAFAHLHAVLVRLRARPCAPAPIDAAASECELDFLDTPEFAAIAIEQDADGTVFDLRRVLQFMDARAQ